MVKPHNLIQQRIVEAEAKLKEDHGFTTEQLEEIGVDSPTALQYLGRLEDKIEQLEQPEVLREP